jgi:hypothetical protein
MNYEWYRLYRSYENCILDMQMSKVPIISGYDHIVIFGYIKLPLLERKLPDVQGQISSNEHYYRNRYKGVRL